MRERLATMPRWALFLSSTLIFLLPMLITTVFDNSHLVVRLVFFAGFSLVFGAITTFALTRRFRSERLVVGDVPPAVENAAHKAVMRGPVPTDPEVRAATLRLAEHQLSMMLKWRPVVVIAFAVVTVGTVIQAFDSPWRLVLVACYVTLLFGQWHWPKKLRRRIEQLAEPGETVG